MIAGPSVLVKIEDDETTHPAHDLSCLLPRLRMYLSASSL